MSEPSTVCYQKRTTPGWWFSIFFMFTPILGDMIQFDHGLVQPPTRLCFVCFARYVWVYILKKVRMLISRICWINQCSCLFAEIYHVQHKVTCFPFGQRMMSMVQSFYLHVLWIHRQVFFTVGYFSGFKSLRKHLQWLVMFHRDQEVTSWWWTVQSFCNDAIEHVGLHMHI